MTLLPSANWCSSSSTCPTRDAMLGSQRGTRRYQRFGDISGWFQLLRARGLASDNDHGGILEPTAVPVVEGIDPLRRAACSENSVQFGMGFGTSMYR
mmetsp:Transcript_83084/g.144299  ORF Transcript_83084/g.144299 Transcript_83084/m.144299 type:complete len:97 (+) Transcript_83084:887-1177(+)